MKNRSDASVVMILVYMVVFGVLVQLVLFWVLPSIGELIGRFL